MTTQESQFNSGDVFFDNRRDEKMIINSVRKILPYYIDEDGTAKPAGRIIQYYYESWLEEGEPPNNFSESKLRSLIDQEILEPLDERYDVNDLHNWTRRDYEIREVDLKEEQEIEQKQGIIQKLKDLMI